MSLPAKIIPLVPAKKSRRRMRLNHAVPGLVLRKGKVKRIRLKDVENIDEIRTALRAEAPLHGITCGNGNTEADRPGPTAVRGYA